MTTTTTTTCPSWCTTIHRAADDEAMSALDLGPVHVHTILHTDTAQGGRIIVAVEQLEDGSTSIWADAPDVLTIEEALEMATALTAAAAFAGEVSR